MNFLTRLLERLVIVVVSLSVIWLIVTQVFDRLDDQINVFGALAITYLVSAYFILPQVIQFTAFILRKGHIPGFTRANDGLPADPVNIILLGTAAELRQVFTEIGWFEAEPLNIRTSVKMIVTFIRNTAYPTAPFSSLFLFGRKQDIGFQESIGNSPRQRHHIRFWMVDSQQSFDPLDATFWLKKHEIDPAQAQMWVGACTKDMGFGLATLTLQISHRVDRKIDEEREFILTALRQADCLGEVTYHESGHYTVGKYITDRRIAVAQLRLNS